MKFGFGPRHAKFGPSAGFFFILFIFYIAFSNPIQIQTYVLNFNFLSAKINPNINFTVYNIIIFKILFLIIYSWEEQMVSLKFPFLCF
jgi:hypothetical protein